MTDERKIVTGWLEVPKRGPGGHWYRYEAHWFDDPDTVAYGITALEARTELRKRSAKT